MAMSPVRTAVVGCGDISSIYLENAAKWECLEVNACASRTLAHAERQAAKFKIARAISIEAALGDAGIELIVNLTVPAVHGSIALAALRAGKSVYNEKPLAMSREEAGVMLREAEARGLRVGCAPDTFMGAGLQTCRKLIDDGEIGTPVAATAMLLSRGPENWHPDPGFLFKVGAGPLFDMGPYYLTALVSMLGPVRRVSGAARTTYPERTIRSEPRRGTKIAVETPTHVAGLLEFASGPVVTLVTTWDVWDMYLPKVEIYGSGGTLTLPDPNTFGGPVRVRGSGAAKEREVALTHGHAENSRGIGVADMAYAMRSGRAHRANGVMAYHVLDVMHAVLESAASGRRVDIASTCERPAPLVAGASNGALGD